MAKKRKATKGSAKRNAKAKDLTARGNPKGGETTAILKDMHDTAKPILQNLHS